MTSVIQHGRRRGGSKTAEEPSLGTLQPPDLRQVVVLPRAEWRRIQDEVNKVDKERESVREAARRREALHLQSKEVVKLWSNTIAGQRQKKLEAKKIREQAEEERRKQIDVEEAKYQEEKRKEVIAKAKTQLYYQSDRVKGLHGALLLSEVLKEREAQVELKTRIKSSSKDVDKDHVNAVKTREDRAQKQEQEKALEKKLQRKAVAEELKTRIRENELVKEQQRMETVKDGEEIQRLQTIYQWEQKMEEEKQDEQRRKLMQAHLEHITDRNRLRAEEAQKQEAEEEQRKRFLSAKEKMMKMRRDKEMELIGEVQKNRERILDRLTVTQQEQSVSEEQRIANAVAEQEAKQGQERREEEERRAAMLKSITAHRRTMRQEKEQKDQEMQRKAKELHRAIKEADDIFLEREKMKAQNLREEQRKLQEFNTTQVAVKSARQQQLRQEDHIFEERNRVLMDEEELQFQEYSRSIIGAAAEAERNVIPLCKAAREGIGGGHGPVYGGVRPSYLVQDRSGAQMPKYVSDVTQNVKTIHEVRDIQEAKKRLGFIW